MKFLWWGLAAACFYVAFHFFMGMVAAHIQFGRIVRLFAAHRNQRRVRL